MKKQVIENGSTSREKLLKGINKLSDAVVCTLGPNGRNVLYIKDHQVISTKDGVSIAKHIQNLEDPIENLGIQLIKQASIKTADNAGDGTTTSTLLASKMVNEGVVRLNNGANAIDIKRGIDYAVEKVINEIKNVSQPIKSQDQLEQIATISANNDESIGKLISTALEKVGREGIVHIENSKTGETYLETVEGMQFDRGYKSPYFVTNNNTMSCVLNDVYILIADYKFTQVRELLPILESVSSANKSLLIIAEDIDNEALATLIVNKMRGILKVCAVKAPDFGERKKLILEDLAVLTGGQVFSPEKGMKLDKFSWEWFGEARVVTVGKEKTTIIDGKGKEKDINDRIEELGNQIGLAQTPFEKERLQDRISKFIGGVAIVHVGGMTETEMYEKKDRVDDALHATKAAIEEGILPGGGVALLKASLKLNDIPEKSSDFNFGVSIVKKVCKSPFIQILTNAGYDNLNIINHLNKILEDGNAWSGFDIKTNQLIDMKEMGIIDPLKVTKNALLNASSIAGTILLTECVVVDRNDDEKEDNGVDLSALGM
jgi:chaperonin GroEL